MINCRELLKTAALTLLLIQIAKTQELAKKSNGFPPLKPPPCGSGRPRPETRESRNMG
jgi:hypothetical protein